MNMRLWKYIFIILLLILSLEVLAIFRLPDSRFHIIACNVGQGDATLITFGKIEILTDGGPDGKVLDCLSKHVPFWDRELELVILTHPHKDHFSGLIDVFKRYKVDNFLYNGLGVGDQGIEVLEKEVGSSGARVIQGVAGTKLRLDLMQLDILAPTVQLPFTIYHLPIGNGTANGDVNSLSIVSLIGFGNFRALLTGDIQNEVSDALAQNWPNGQVHYIKIPHHGSKQGLTENLLKRLVPKVALISAGKNNIYGHPHKEILEMLSKYNVEVYRTDTDGEKEFITDGVKIWQPRFF